MLKSLSLFLDSSQNKQKIIIKHVLLTFSDPLKQRCPTLSLFVIYGEWPFKFDEKRLLVEMEKSCNLLFFSICLLKCGDSVYSVYRVYKDIKQRYTDTEL
jgi:hypothetical protein